MQLPSRQSDDHEPVPLRPVSAQGAVAPVPTPTTRLIGRESELSVLNALLQDDDVRLVTIVGPGGVGKTRLAIEVATSLAAAFPDGARFVSLAEIPDPDLVEDEIARSRHDHRTAGSALAAYRDVDGLLVLDNFEHLADAAPFLMDLLGACPRLTLLVTSRTVLRLSAERVVTVAPLPVESGGRDGGAPLEGAAVRLFVDRARARRHDFALTPDNARAVAGICAAVDGLPLAIVLAASQIDVMSPDSLLERLRHRGPLLDRGPRDAPDRHRSVDAAIAWSYGLLDEPARTALRRLAVFVGGFTLDAASVVLGPDADPLDAIGVLVGSSLLAVGSTDAGETRYAMLEPIREFALLRLASGDEAEPLDRTPSGIGEVDELRAHHAAYFSGIAEWADWAWYMPPGDGEPRLARLDAETPNLRAALDWLHRRAKHAELLDMAMRLGGLWVVLGHPQEGMRWLETGLRDGRDIPPAVRARALATLSWCVNTAGNPIRALELGEEALAIWRTLGDPIGLAQALILCGVPAIRVEGRQGDAVRWFEEGIGALSDVESPPWVVNVRASLRLQCGAVALNRGDLAEAERIFQALRADEASRGLDLGGSHVYGMVLPLALADVARARGDNGTALDLYRGVLPAAFQARNYRSLCHALAGTAGALAVLGEIVPAARLFGACEALHERLGFQFDELFDRQRACGLPEPWLRAGDSFGDWQRLREAAQESVWLPPIRKPGVADTAWAEGRAMPIEVAINEAHAATPVMPTSPAHRLSAREIDVLQLLADGMTDVEIAHELFISRRTAATHIRHIYDKIGVSSRAAAAAWAVRNGVA